jgi:general secretion pathway protein D
MRLSASMLLVCLSALLPGFMGIALAQNWPPQPLPGPASQPASSGPYPGQSQFGLPVTTQAVPGQTQHHFAPAPQHPKGPKHLVDLPRIDNRAISELVAGLISRFELENGYTVAAADRQKELPVPATVVAEGPLLSRIDANRKTHLLRFGYLRPQGQLPQLWVSGIVAPDATTPNPDLVLVDSAVSAILASRVKNAADDDADLSMMELRAQVINLAYIDADSAVSMLKAMGFNVGGTDRAGSVSTPSGFGSSQPGFGQGLGQQSAIPGSSVFQPYQQTGATTAWGAPQVPVQQAGTSASTANRRIRNSDLPLVIRMPGPNPQDVGLVGASSDGAIGAPGVGQNGSTTILGATTRLSTETVSSPTSQLMVMYNPDRPEQLGLVQKAIAESIDTPARQLVIEAMVLEVTSSGLSDLGVQWNLQKGFNTLSLGTLTTGAASDTLGFSRNTGLAQQLTKQFFVNVQALVQSGKAEVLARPSVLTLDNRQASIRIGTDIPIATSRDDSSATDSRVSYSFYYLPTGIQLNVRPRIDNDGSEVSLQVDAAVSATVANLGAQIRSPGDVILAAAPAVSTRRVQTYARIPNATPLIIGGLISHTGDQASSSTPGLGQLPLIGPLFGGARKDTSSKDEVIIVLTPYVLEKGRSGLEAALPQDTPAFDYSQHNELFRKSFRLQAEDLMSTTYIRENARLVLYQKLVNGIAAIDASRVDNTPLAQVLGKRIPGAQTLMTGVLYNVVRNHYDGGQIPIERMQLFKSREQGEVVVQSLADLLAKLGNGRTPESFFRTNPGKCLAITFTSHRQQMTAGNVLEEPEPKTEVVDCKPDRSDWASVLYGLNRNTTDTTFNTILIEDRSDLVRLSNAIVLRRLIAINGGAGAIDFDRIDVGRVVAMPEFDPVQNHFLDAEVARDFYLSQHYLRAFEEDFEESLSAIETLLRSGKFNDVVRPAELPDVVGPAQLP